MAVVCWCSPVRVVSVVSFVCCDLVRCDVEVVRWIGKINNRMYMNFNSNLCHVYEPNSRSVAKRCSFARVARGTSYRGVVLFVFLVG